MLHELRIYELVPGGVPAFLRVYEAHALPLVRQHVRVLGLWTADSGALNRVYHLLAFGDEEARRQQYLALKTQPAFINDFFGVAAPLLRTMQSILLIPSELDGAFPLFGHLPEVAPMPASRS